MLNFKVACKNVTFKYTIYNGFPNKKKSLCSQMTFKIFCYAVIKIVKGSLQMNKS